MTRAIISRDDAEMQGLKRFYTGVLCLRSHDAERFVSNGGCVLCVNRATPKKHKMTGFQFFPARPLNFGNAADHVPSDIEAQAVFRWMEAAEWHLAALKLLRADPVLMARFDHDMTQAEKFETGRGTPDPAPTKP